MNPAFRACAFGAALASALIPAARADVTVHDFSAGSQWRTSTDPFQGQQWGRGNFNATDGVAAWANYSNPATTVLDPAHMMWNCGADGSACRNGSGFITGANGPSETYYGLDFTIHSGEHVAAALMSIIGDDFFDVVVNDQEVMAGILDQHMTANGQPNPVTLDLAPYLREGHNVLAIRAMDGYLMGAGSCRPGFTEVSSNLGEFCTGQRGDQYLYVSGGAITVPEPGVLALVGIALAALAWRRPPSV
jgi:hypothetical protein